MLFEKESLQVRQLLTKDNHLLAKWLSNPLVLEFYEGRDNPFDIEIVNKKFYNQKNNRLSCIVMYKEVEIGYIQYYQLDEKTRATYGYDESENIYGIDQFIGETEYWNRGIGTLLVKSMVDFLMQHKQVDRVVMDPQITNKRALKCYEKCGFTKVKILSKHEFHEGEYRDCWLMEFRRFIRT
ncbi:GNAT family N-acetyltransferase [Virgibacillus sp. NKC19-16]|uniref:GNAT family N-acetyltransferase n=1 Tax=Virgibacillus salidurans TaxID=2831673 RepID=UPI001F2F2452|nr:GNAT family N-acetyltransferase [Virgibacillus sp. NKC19-16]UJL46069.1 GNAT family N-acetyltransferase [Virgibacillus sp. NKC19-16]